MGLFDFLKKPKESSLKPGMELPPLPEMESIGGFPELPKDTLPPLPEETLPPLPQMVPSKEPKMPSQKKSIDLPPLGELPPLPTQDNDMLEDTPTPPAREAQTAPAEHPYMEFPLPPMHDIVPDKIPPLEGVPEPPRGNIQKVKLSEIPKKDVPEIKKDYSPRINIDTPRETYQQIRTQQVRKQLQGPIFVRTEMVRQILSNVEDIQITFRSEDDIFFRITEVKNTQDKKYENIRQSLEDMQRKLLFIDKTLFER